MPLMPASSDWRFLHFCTGFIFSPRSCSLILIRFYKQNIFYFVIVLEKRNDYYSYNIMSNNNDTDSVATVSKIKLNCPLSNI